MIIFPFIHTHFLLFQGKTSLNKKRSLGPAKQKGKLISDNSFTVDKEETNNENTASEGDFEGTLGSGVLNRVLNNASVRVRTPSSQVDRLQDLPSNEVGYGVKKVQSSLFTPAKRLNVPKKMMDEVVKNFTGDDNSITDTDYGDFEPTKKSLNFCEDSVSKNSDVFREPEHVFKDSSPPSSKNGALSPCSTTSKKTGAVSHCMDMVDDALIAQPIPTASYVKKRVRPEPRTVHLPPKRIAHKSTGSSKTRDAGKLESSLDEDGRNGGLSQGRKRKADQMGEEKEGDEECEIQQEVVWDCDENLASVMGPEDEVLITVISHSFSFI